MRYLGLFQILALVIRSISGAKLVEISTSTPVLYHNLVEMSTSLLNLLRFEKIDMQ